MDLDARTSGGKVRFDREVSIEGRIDPNHIQGAINGGGEELRVNTSGGQIRINLR